MPNVPTNVTSGGGVLNATSQATGSITPAANALILLFVKSKTGITANPNQPTASGCSLTWVVIDSIVTDDAGASRHRMTIFRAMGAAPTTGAVTIDFGGQTQTHSCYIIDQITGVSVFGTNGSGAVVQEVNANQPSSTFDASLQPSITATLAAFKSPSNGTYAAFGNGNSTETLTNGTGFTTVTDVTDSGGGSMEIRTMWDSANQTSVQMSFSPNDAEDGIFGLEIAAFIPVQLTQPEQPYLEKTDIVDY